MKIALVSDLHRGISANTHVIHKKFLTSLNETEFDVLLVAGDLGTSSNKHFLSMVKALREYVPNRPIAIVKGNHDFWDKELHSIPVLVAEQAVAMNDLGIHHLEEGPLVIEGVLFTGWDGWYAQPEYSLPTNDHKWMPNNVAGCPTGVYLQDHSRKQFQRVLDELEQPARARIVMTHMPTVSGMLIGDERYNGPAYYWDFLIGKCDVYCFGHTHRAMDVVHQGIRILNCGADYDKPLAKVFSI